MNSETKTRNELIVLESQEWVKSIIVGLNFCPFARREVEKKSINYRVVESGTIERYLEALIIECVSLDQNEEVETALLIFPDTLDSFEGFLDFYDLADTLLVEQGYEGIYQLASFHPSYRFAESEEDDAANYTNRSPHPMLHLIREVSIERVLENVSNPEAIPAENIERARALGTDKMASLLKACFKGKY
jgi:hypothetical protein